MSNLVYLVTSVNNKSINNHVGTGNTKSSKKSQINLITWTKTNCTKDMLVYDGYMYQFCKPDIGDDFYRCCMSRAATVAINAKVQPNFLKIEHTSQSNQHHTIIQNQYQRRL